MNYFMLKRSPCTCTLFLYVHVVWHLHVLSMEKTMWVDKMKLVYVYALIELKANINLHNYIYRTNYLVQTVLSTGTCIWCIWWIHDLSTFCSFLSLCRLMYLIWPCITGKVHQWLLESFFDSCWGFVCWDKLKQLGKVCIDTYMYLSIICLKTISHFREVCSTEKFASLFDTLWKMSLLLSTKVKYVYQ